MDSPVTEKDSRSSTLGDTPKQIRFVADAVPRVTRRCSPVTVDRPTLSMISTIAYAMTTNVIRLRCLSAAIRAVRARHLPAITLRHQHLLTLTRRIVHAPDQGASAFCCHAGSSRSRGSSSLAADRTVTAPVAAPEQESRPVSAALPRRHLDAADATICARSTSNRFCPVLWIQRLS